MKKISLIIGLMGAWVTLQCSALTVDIYRNANWSQSPGGEFNVQLDASGNSAADVALYNYILSHYTSSSIISGGFQTFCINTSIDLQGNPQVATINPNGISLGTAWLYSQFVHGTLVGYNYTVGSGRVSSAWELQNAIWLLQGQTVFDAAAANVFLTSSQFTAVFSSLAAAEVASGGKYGVASLPLTYTPVTGGQVASQPMLVQVPDGGSTLMFLGVALSGVGLIVRRRWSR